MNTQIKYAQFYLRLALGIDFIVPVLDRLGFIGSPGQKFISWGDWSHFIGFTGMLVPFLSKPLINISGLIATVLEVIFGLGLIIGLKTRLMAYGSFVLTLVFGICMAIFLGYKAPLNFQVFACSAGSLLLSTLVNYNWSIDDYFTNKKHRI